MRLLDRLGRGRRPSPRAGAPALGYAHAHARRCPREARQAMDSFQGRMSGELLVGASTIPGEYVLPALIGRFKEKFPDIAITLLIGDSRAVTEWVAEGRAEVAWSARGRPTAASTIRELMPDELVLVVPRGASLARAQGGHARGSARASRCSLRERGSGTRAALERALAQAGIDLAAFRIVGEMGSTQAIKQAVKAGVGVSLVSRRAVEEECRAGSLVVPPRARTSRSPAPSTSPPTGTAAARRSPRPSGPSSNPRPSDRPHRAGPPASLHAHGPEADRSEDRQGDPAHRATPPARAERPRWVLEISRTCSGGLRAARSTPICSSGSAGATTPPSTA